MRATASLYAEARAAHGIWLAYRFLILRRLSQIAFLAVFLTGPLAGIWIAKGTLAASMTLGVLPLTDPFVLVQSLAARHWPEGLAITGAAIVLAFYLIFGGRSYCAWVCPINPVSDLAAWLRRRLGITQTARLRPEFRVYLAVAVMVVSALGSVVAWELVNPITALHRALVFGTWFGASGALAIFVFDLFAAKDGWCSHLCPVGAFYGAIGKIALARVSARGRDRCDNCMKCFEICPEPQIIAPALRGGKSGASPVILSGDCTLCGGCIDVCPERVFQLSPRFNQRTDAIRPPGLDRGNATPIPVKEAV